MRVSSRKYASSVLKLILSFASRESINIDMNNCSQ